jgi:hypothetical protein
VTLPEFIRKKSLNAEYAKALQWLKSLGIDYSLSRFAKYEKDIEKLENFTSVEKIKNSDDKAVLDSYDSALEAHDLIMIHKGLGGIKEDELTRKLKWFVGGPVHASNEKSDGRSHVARNTGIELLVTSNFVLGGFKVNFQTDADVVVIDKDNHFQVECKRSSKESTLKSNLDKAYSQLKRRYAEYEESCLSRGFVVLSIGKIVNPENKVLGVKDGSEILGIMDQIVRDFLNNNKSIWQRNLHEKTMAVFAYLQMAANAQNRHGTFIVSHYGGLYLRPGHLPDIKDLDLDRLYFREIVSRMNEGARNALDDGR